MQRMTLATALLLMGCNSPAVRTDSTSNPDVAVELLFEHEGCQAYRFSDGGRKHYYVRCSATQRVTTEAYHTEPCGKGCVRTVIDVVATEETP